MNEKRIINGNGTYFENVGTICINEEETVEVGVMEITIKKNIDVMEIINKNAKYEKAIKEAIELLSKEGINSKQKAKELLEGVLENDK